MTAAVAINSRRLQVLSNAPQDFCVLLVGVVETWGVNNDHAVAFEMRAVGDRVDYNRMEPGSTRDQLVTDAHSLFPEEDIDKLDEPWHEV